MKQIVDKLNKIAKKINENVELSDRDLIIDSLDSITKAYGGTPNDSTLIVDKLEDIYNNVGSAPSGNIEITENTAEGEPLDISQYATATVNVAGGGLPTLHATIINNFGATATIDSTEEMPFASKQEYGYSAHVTFGGNTTTEIEALYFKHPLAENLYMVLPKFTSIPTDPIMAVSNLENCTYDEETNAILITDPTQNSSATLTLSAIS